MLPADELAQTLGLGPGTGQHGRFNRALDRLAQFRLAEWIEPGRSIAVYTEVAPLTRSPPRAGSGVDPGGARTAARCPPRPDRHRQGLQRPGHRDHRAARPLRATHRPGPSPEQGPRTMTPRTPGTRPGSVPVPARSTPHEGQIRRAHICRFPSGKPAGPSRSGRP